MDRTLQGVSSIIEVTFSVDGEPANPSPDAATVTVTRSDGTELYTDATAADEGDGVFSLALTPTDTALLDTLTATWSMEYGSETQTITTEVEIVGGFYFTVAEARALEGLAEDQYTAQEIVYMRTLVEQAIDDAFGVAFVPRYTTETLDGQGANTALLKWPYIRAIRSLSIDGTAGTPANVAFQPTGTIYYANRFTAGYSNIIVGYEHGRPYPPERLRRGALRLARRWLVDGPVDDRRTFETTDAGTFGLLTPGRGGAIFDIPELEALRNVYGMTVGIA